MLITQSATGLISESAITARTECTDRLLIYDPDVSKPSWPNTSATTTITGLISRVRNEHPTMRSGTCCRT